MDLAPEILARARAGHRASQAEVLRRSVGPVRALIHRLGVPHEREDQVQDALAHLLRALPQFDPRGAAKFSTWAFTVVHRWLLMQRRRRRVELVPLQVAEDVADGRVGADVQVERRELRAMLDEAVAALPEGQRQVFVLAVMHEVPLEAIAEAEGVALGTVKSRLHRARAVLALRLGERLDAPEQKGAGHAIGR